jgi:hypothetical protein
MEITTKNRHLGLAGALLAMVLLSGCVNTGGANPGGMATSKFTFIVTPVPVTGSLAYIDVQPLSPTDGLYGGGNARIESKSASDRNVVVWQSRNPFWIRFESMKSNRGNGGNRFGPADFTKSKDDGAEPYKYYFEQTLPTGGGKTESAKYFVTFAGVDPIDPRKAVGFVLDPVIIVDR